MKAKKFLILSITILIIISLVLSAIPYTSILMKEENLNKNPQSNGDTYYYKINTFPGTFYWNNTTVYNKFVNSKYYTNYTENGYKEKYIRYDSLVSENGILILKIIGNKMHFTTVLSFSNCSFQKPFKIVTRHFTLPYNSSFASNFLNSYSNRQGNAISIGNEFGVIHDNYTNTFNCYNVPYKGDNTTLKKDNGVTYDTVPFMVHFPKFNKTLPSSWVPYRDFNAYDRVGSTNVLVQSNLGGNSPFLRYLLVNNTIMYHNHNVIPSGVGDFELRLIATNVALGPVAIVHYLKEYLPIDIILWATVMPSVYFTIVRKKRIVSSKNKKR